MMMIMMALEDVVFTFCDTCIARGECSIVIISVLSFIISSLVVQHKRVYCKVCRLEKKVLNYVHVEDIIKCNIITGTSVSVCKFRTSHAGMFVSVLPLLWQYRARPLVIEVVVNWVRTPRILSKLILCWSFISFPPPPSFGFTKNSKSLVSM